ncbi:hypothetical protein NLG97_g25 [Lecanicillium saksenae]|uniref:Uncharacterized protein n=1 Tax=Lecanicillium saksenae TaxID=468837 RepID=A0ACC1R9L4_9HYPO|nr:hypothetical protein NLG97_g25 [Lecanicillium saksenae]
METVLHIQSGQGCPSIPLILIHAISGLALPYLALGELGRDVYGISAPLFEHGNASPMPQTLAEVAAIYVAIVRREIQPHGPYLLGGWSLGGMIAVEMARIFASRGEIVAHVIMIDSMNPEKFLPFRDAREHRLVASLTYNAIARRMSGPIEPATLGDLDSEMFDRGSTSSSGSSSADASGENSSADASSDEDDDDLVAIFYSHMRRHIQGGLRMLSAYRSSTTAASNRRGLAKMDVTLVKCKLPGALSPFLDDHRRSFAKKNEQR